MDRKRKRELRDLNQRVWNDEKDLFEVAPSLDSSLKKNTAFIKRLRTGLTSSSQASFIAEIKSLSLQKYLSEVISATAEGLGRLKTASDLSAGAEVVGALHQRFGPAQFTKQLGWLLGKGLTSPDKAQVKLWSSEVREREEKERIARHRVLLRVATEFWLCGILRSLDDVERPEDAGVKGRDATQSESGRGVENHKVKNALNGIRIDGAYDSDPFPLEVLKDLLGHDPDLVNLPLAVLFVKHYSWDILGVKRAAEDSRKTVDGDGEILNDTKEEAGSGEELEDDTPIIPERTRQRFTNVFDRYVQAIKKRIVRDQEALNNQSRRNAEAYVRSGEIFEDRQANFERMIKAQDRLVANGQILCDVLGQEMPNLNQKAASDSTTTSAVGIVKTGDYLRGQGEAAGIWEDEEERRFYENLVDLKGRVPAILLEDGKKVKGDAEDQVQGFPSSDGSSEKPVSSEREDLSMQIANKTVGAQVDALLMRLSELQSKDQVDQIAHDFCFVNSKASRNRLVKSIQDIPKARTDLLPLYARLAATLGQYMPDVVHGLISHLDDEFRSLQRRKSKDFLGQVRLINIRYLAELTKFGVVPEHVIFHCFKVSLDDFSRMNIEIIANLLENCGRYLLRNSETSPRMASFLETLGRKKSAQHLGPQERMLMENALYYVDPPQRAAIEQKDRTPTELFVRQLVYLDMTKKNYMKILKTIRKLHWEEREIVQLLGKIFSKPAKVKFSSIRLLAVLLGALSRYHQDFAITVIDNVLENITLGLEQNDFKLNQKRISEVKYLGELYNYKMVDSTVVFDTLYRILTFGHESGTPTPEKTSPYDLPDDFFRIRLVCTILDTCGVFFDRGSSRKKLDFFLTFFQYYLLTKDPLPMEVEFLVQDTYTLVRPQWEIVTDLTEAAKLFGEAVATRYAQQESDKAMDVHEDNDDSGASDGGIGDDDGPGDAELQDSSGDEAKEADEEDDGVDEVDAQLSEEEHIIVVREEEKLDPEMEAEFDAAFASMMAESYDSRRNERQTRFDVPLPVRKAQRNTVDALEDGSGSGADTPPTTMAFSLMTKKGNRQQTRTLDLPSDSSFALSMKTKQAAEREEQQRIKNLVLNYDLREDDQHDGHDLYNPTFGRAERSYRNVPRSRKLNLNDVDWT